VCQGDCFLRPACTVTLATPAIGIPTTGACAANRLCGVRSAARCLCQKFNSRPPLAGQQWAGRWLGLALRNRCAPDICGMSHWPPASSLTRR
jgi:hypothetical protein